MSDLVLYHGPICRDGFTAAWLAWLHLGDDATYRPIGYADPMPDDFGTFDRVFFLDFGPKPSAVRAAARPGQSIVVLDHHETARRFWRNSRPVELTIVDESPSGFRVVGECEGVDYQVVIDESKSGAGMTCDYMGTLAGGKIADVIEKAGADLFPLADYVEDRDLWRWFLPHSRAVNAAIRAVDLTFPAWTELNRELWKSLGDDGPHGRLAVRESSSIVERGRAILSTVEDMANTLSFGPLRLDFFGQPAVAVNTSALRSEVGEMLLAKNPGAKVAITWWVDAENQRLRLSCRARKGEVNVADLLITCGGGGHPAAAGAHAALTDLGNLRVFAEAVGIVPLTKLSPRTLMVRPVYDESWEALGDRLDGIELVAMQGARHVSASYVRMADDIETADEKITAFAFGQFAPDGDRTFRGERTTPAVRAANEWANAAFSVWQFLSAQAAASSKSSEGLLTIRPGMTDDEAETLRAIRRAVGLE